MNKKIGGTLVIFSLLLAGLSYLVYHLAPEVSRPTLVAGLAGGALCLMWGILALGGSKGKAASILTLIPVSFTLMPQAFSSWQGKESGWEVAALKTVLLVICVGMLIRIAWSGVVFDVQSGSGTPLPRSK